jgi:hypothetical protein
VTRVPVPVRDIDDHPKLRDRYAYYTQRPTDAAALIERERTASQALRDARAERLRASWIYGEDQPDV